MQQPLAPSCAYAECGLSSAGLCVSRVLRWLVEVLYLDGPRAWMQRGCVGVVHVSGLCARAHGAAAAARVVRSTAC